MSTYLVCQQWHTNIHSHTQWFVLWAHRPENIPYATASGFVPYTLTLRRSHVCRWKLNVFMQTTALGCVLAWMSLSQPQLWGWVRKKSTNVRIQELSLQQTMGSLCLFLSLTVYLCLFLSVCKCVCVGGVTSHCENWVTIVARLTSIQLWCTSFPQSSGW